MYDYDNKAQKMKNEISHLLGGYFEYFRGGVYVLNCVATDWETKQLMVVYTEIPPPKDETYTKDIAASKEDPKTFIRPFSLFFGYVENEDGDKISRFHYMGKMEVKAQIKKTDA